MNMVNIKMLSKNLSIKDKLNKRIMSNKLLKIGNERGNYHSKFKKCLMEAKTYKDINLIINELKRAFIKRWGNLNKVSINKEGITQILNFLIELGIPKETLSAVESNAWGSGTVKLSKFFGELLDTLKEDQKINPALLIESSSIPYLERFIRSQGVFQAESQEIIESSKDTDGRIRLDILLNKLNQLKERHINSSTQFKRIEKVINSLKEEMIKKEKIESEKFNLPNSDNKIVITLKDLKRVINEGMLRNRDLIKGENREFIDENLKNDESSNLTHNNLKNQDAKYKDSILSKIDELINQLETDGKIKHEERILSNLNNNNGVKYKNVKITQVRKEAVGHLKDFNQKTPERDVDTREKESIKREQLNKSGWNKNDSTVRSKEKESIKREQPNKLEINTKDIIRYKNNSVNEKRDSTVIRDISQGKGKFKSLIDPGLNAGINNINKFIQAEPIPKGDTPKSVVSQIYTQIQNAINNGRDSVTFNLHPPELGSLNINVRLKSNNLKLNLKADNGRTVDIIISNIHSLKEALIEHGIRLESFNIKIDYSFNALSENNQYRWNEREENNKTHGSDESNINDSLMENELKTSLSREIYLSQERLDILI